MRTPPFTDNLDPMQRVCICGCHCGSLIPVSRHAAKQAGPRSSGKAVLTGRIQRVGAVRGRIRKITAVALARKLLVALWRYVTTGLVPEGARLKAA